LVKGDVNDLINIKDGNAAPEICKAVFDAAVNLFPRPHEAVFELF
jgi:hypothetical protein